jgi:uncharacterized protein (DUF58 family)
MTTQPSPDPVRTPLASTPFAAAPLGVATEAAASAPRAPVVHAPGGTGSLAPAPLAAAGQAGHRWPFGVGTRGLVLLAAGLIWIVPAWIDRRTLLLLAVWDIVLLAAWLVDLRRLPAPAQIRVTRSWSDPLGLGTPARVALTLRQDGATPIHACLIDFVTADLRREPPAREMTVPPGHGDGGGGEARVEYDVLPRERGDMAMGVTIVRYESPWGLAARWATMPLAQTVRVYPNLRDAQKQALFLVRSKQTSLERRRVRERGAGRDFESLRDYQDGDDPRDICWSATARRAKLVTKRYQPERSQVVWILVDAGRLLRARVAGHTKLDYGVNSALALAQVAMLSGDRVGLLAYGRRPQQRVAPGRGALHLRAMVEALAAVRGETVEADHTAAASAVLSMQKRRALIVWLTEVAETAGVPEVIESSQRMAPRHVVFLALTKHPELAALAAARPDSQTEMYRVMAAQQTLERREELLHGLRQRGVLTLEQPPGELSAAVVDRYLSVKARSLL